MSLKFWCLIRHWWEHLWSQTSIGNNYGETNFKCPRDPWKHELEKKYMWKKNKDIHICEVLGRYLSQYLRNWCNFQNSYVSIKMFLKTLTCLLTLKYLRFSSSLCLLSMYQWDAYPTLLLVMIHWYTHFKICLLQITFGQKKFYKALFSSWYSKTIHSSLF